MFQNLSEHTRGINSLDTLVIIENLRFMNDINKVKAIDDHNEPLTKFLKQLEHRIKSNKCEKLLFPAHMKMIKHWHLKQGKIGQLSEVCDKCSVKSIIFEPFM